MVLLVDTGRWQMYRTQSGWKALPRHRRKCLLCFSAVEDHGHVLCDCPAYKSDRERLMAQIQNHCPVTLPETLQSEKDRDKFIEVALFGEGQQYTAKFLRKAMRHRSVILHDETIFF